MTAKNGKTTPDSVPFKSNPLLKRKTKNERIRKLRAKFARVHWRKRALLRRPHSVDLPTIARNALMYARCRGLWSLRSMAEDSSGPEFEYTYDSIEFALQEIENLVDNNAVHLVISLYDEIDRVQETLKMDDVMLLELLAGKMMITMSRYEKTAASSGKVGNVNVFCEEFLDIQDDLHSVL